MSLTIMLNSRPIDGLAGSQCERRHLMAPEEARRPGGRTAGRVKQRHLAFALPEGTQQTQKVQGLRTRSISRA